MEDKIVKVPVLRVEDGKQQWTEDIVVREFSVTITVNNRELVSILCSPQKLDYLAAGFLLSQGLIKSKEDLISIRVDEKSACVLMEIKPQVEISYKPVVASSGGKGMMLFDSPEVSKESGITIAPPQVLSLVEKFVKHSKVFTNTGGVHSAALCNIEDIILFSEDIGRHNAIDKIFGEALLKDIPLKDYILLTSGRVSSEILVKAARRNIPVLISKSAPTDAGIRLADELGVTLIGFVRGNKMNVYTNNRRVVTTNAE
jgi:FdhD protein